MNPILTQPLFPQLYKQIQSPGGDDGDEGGGSGCRLLSTYCVLGTPVNHFTHVSILYKLKERVHPHLYLT